MNQNVMKSSYFLKNVNYEKRKKFILKNAHNLCRCEKHTRLLENKVCN